MRMGFEPTRAEHNGLAVHHLNHSAKKGAKGTARPGEKKKRERKEGGKREKEKEKKGGKRALYHFLSPLLSFQHWLHTVSSL